MECTIETVKINEDRNVIARHFCGNLWWELQTETVIPSLHTQFLGVFLKSYTDFVILNDKELANFEITSGYPLPITVETPNKGHFGTNINSSGLSTV